MIVSNDGLSLFLRHVCRVVCMHLQADVLLLLLLVYTKLSPFTVTALKTHCILLSFVVPLTRCYVLSKRLSAYGQPMAIRFFW
jgi:hypothetical protein